MARSANADPLEKFRFQLTLSDDSQPTSLSRVGFHDMQMPKRSTNKINYREGIDPDVSSISAGLSSMEDVTMSRGIIAEDSNNELYKWMSSVHSPKSTDGVFSLDSKSNGSGNISGSDEYRKDVTVTMFDRNGDTARVWKLYNAFPVNFVPGSDLNADEDDAKSLEQLTLAYEDFEEMQVTDSSSSKDQASNAANG